MVDYARYTKRRHDHLDEANTKKKEYEFQLSHLKGPIDIGRIMLELFCFG